MNELHEVQLSDWHLPTFVFSRRSMMLQDVAYAGSVYNVSIAYHIQARIFADP